MTESVMGDLRQLQLADPRRCSAALQASEVRYRRLFEAARDGILILDADSGKIIDVNPFLLELTGYSHEDFLEKYVWEIGPFRDVADAKNSFADLQVKKYLRYDDLPLQALDGRRINVEFVSNVYREGGKNVIQCNIRDITERRRSARALEASEMRYRRLFENAKDGILILDAETGKVTEVNPFLLDLTGYSSADFLGKSLWEVGPFKAMADGKASFEDLAAKKYHRYEDLPLQTLDGRSLDVECVSNVYHVDGRAVIQCNFHDITERKRTLHALEASETRYRRLFECAKDGIFILDAETEKIVDVNPFLLELTGYPREHFLGKYLWEVGPFKDAADAKSSFAELKAKKYVRYDDLPLLARDGRKIDVEFVSNVYRVDGQSVIQCNVRDITARKRSAETLRQTEERFRILFEHAADIVLLLEIKPEGAPVILDANRATGRLLGYEREELVGQPVTLIEGSADASRAIDERRRSVSSDASAMFEVKHRCKDGALLDFECSAAQMQIGSRTLAISVEREVTDRKRAEEKSKGQLEELLRWQKVMLGREDRVQGLKREVNELCRRAGESARYSSQEPGLPDSEAAKPSP